MAQEVRIYPSGTPWWAFLGWRLKQAHNRRRVGKIMNPPKGPHPKPWNLWIFYNVLWQKGVKIVDGIKFAICYSDNFEMGRLPQLIWRGSKRSHRSLCVKEGDTRMSGCLTRHSWLWKWKVVISHRMLTASRSWKKTRNWVQKGTHPCWDLKCSPFHTSDH